MDFVSGLITLTNGNSVVHIDPTSQSGVFSWVVDGVDQLYQHWFWLRQGANGAQVSLDQLGTPLGSSWTATNATLNYLPQGLNVAVGFTLQGGATGSGASSLAETIVIQNTNTSSANLHFYAYTDFDLAGTNAGDTVSFPTNTLAVQQGKGVTATQSVQGLTPSYWEASWYSFAFDTINSATPAVLPDAIIPKQPGDQTFAFQWDTALNQGQSWVLNLANTIQVEPIRLSLLVVGAHALVSWPTNGTAGFQLQSAATLNRGGSWQTVTNAPVTAGSHYQVAVPLLNQTQFYRLQQ